MNATTILSYIAERYSPFAFDEQMIQEDKIMAMFEAAGRAPSSFNDQPWHFLYATKEEPAKYKLFFDCLAEGNQQWAFTAPVLALSVARTFYTRNLKANHMAAFETGMAVANLLVQAMSMGIYVHQMGGFDKDKARQNLEIPADFAPLTMMAIGYEGDINMLPKELHERAANRTGRKLCDSYVYNGKFAAAEKQSST